MSKPRYIHVKPLVLRFGDRSYGWRLIDRYETCLFVSGEKFKTRAEARNDGMKAKAAFYKQQNEQKYEN